MCVIPPHKIPQQTKPVGCYYQAVYSKYKSARFIGHFFTCTRILKAKREKILYVEAFVSECHTSHFFTPKYENSFTHVK